ncbi:hypothetical protein I4U23_007976 [Adineta vaga]|nr:hypothetical protein I4U23_007976 [Adineta vaga]
MNNNYRESPPSYKDSLEKSVYHSSNDRLGTYAVLPAAAEQRENMKYINYNEEDSLMSLGQNILPIEVGHEPLHCTCSNCQSSIVTLVQQTPGLSVWLLCLLTIIIGCWLGCCLIPFCIRGIQNTQHYCPNCKALIGEYRPL